jgi:hypothetical protein
MIDRTTRRNQMFVLIGLVPFLLNGAAHAQDDCGIICRKGNIAHWTKEHFAALEYMRVPTTRLDRMVVFITRRGDCLYLHSNFQSRCPAELAASIETLLEQRRDGEKLNQIETEFLNGLEDGYFKDGDHWYFKHPTKLTGDINQRFSDKLALLVFTKELEGLNVNEFVKAIRNDIIFYVDRAAGDIDLGFARNVHRVDVEREHIGVICERRMIPGYDDDYRDAINQIGDETTTRFEQAVVYINKRQDGYLYVQSNFQPKLADGSVAPFPAKLVTRMESDGFFLISELFFNNNRPDVRPREVPEVFNRFFTAYTDKIRFVVTPSARQAVKLKDALRIEDAQ